MGTFKSFLLRCAIQIYKYVNYTLTHLIVHPLNVLNVKMYRLTGVTR